MENKQIKSPWSGENVPLVSGVTQALLTADGTSSHVSAASITVMPSAREPATQVGVLPSPLTIPVPGPGSSPSGGWTFGQFAHMACWLVVIVLAVYHYRHMLMSRLLLQLGLWSGRRWKGPSDVSEELHSVVEVVQQRRGDLASAAPPTSPQQQQQ